MKQEKRPFPRTVTCGDAEIELQPMTRVDAPDLKAFVDSLPEHDLLFLESDITHPKVIDAWFAALEEGRIQSMVARAEGAFVGCTAIVLQERAWSRHVGELRVLVGPQLRGKGIGRLLIQECFVQALALGLEKLIVQMTIDQKAAIGNFEALGFRAEALLRNHVKDREGNRHDLAILSHDVARVQSMMDALGITDTLGGHRP